MQTEIECVGAEKIEYIEPGTEEGGGVAFCHFGLTVECMAIGGAYMKQRSSMWGEALLGVRPNAVRETTHKPESLGDGLQGSRGLTELITIPSRVSKRMQGILEVVDSVGIE